MKPGLHRHFKGNLYRAQKIVLHSETQEEMVLYKALYGTRRTWARPAGMFDDEVSRCGHIVKRFARLPWWKQLLLFWKR